MFQAQFEPGDLVGVDVAQQPGVGVAAVVAALHDVAPLVDGGGVLRGAAHADELGDAVGVETVEAADGGFGADQAGVGDEEVGAAVNPAGGGLPQDAMAAARAGCPG